MKNVTSFFLMTLFSGFLLISCQSGGIQNTKGTKSIDSSLKIVTIDFQDVNFLVDFAKNKHFFEKNGVNPEFMKISKGTDKLLISNQVDMKIGSMSNALGMYLNGQSPIVLGYTNRQSMAYIFSRFPKDKIKDIKKVAVGTFGSDGHYAVLAFLKNQGLDIKNLDFVAIPDDNTKLGMLKSGKLDLAFMTAFKDISKESKDFTVYHFYDKNTLPGYDSSRAILTNKNALENKKTAVYSFEKSLYETLDYIKNNKDESVLFIGKEFSLDQEKSLMFYDNFVKGLKNEDFVLDPKSLEGVRKVVVEQTKPTDENRDLKGFIFSDFTKEIVGMYPNLNK